MIDTSKLSDTELNRAMIWLYSNSRYIYRDYEVGHVCGNLVWKKKADYLGDWNLTMPLAVKHELMIDLESNTESGEYSAFNVIGDIVGFDKNPLRAICCVLVQIALESK